MLAINVYDQATKERLFPPYSVKEIGGLRVGLVGIASNIVDKTMPPYQEELSTVVGETATALNRATMLETTLKIPKDSASRHSLCEASR